MGSVNQTFQDIAGMQNFSDMTPSYEPGLFGDYVRDTKHIVESTPDYKDVDDYDDSLNEFALRKSGVFKN